MISSIGFSAESIEAAASAAKADEAVIHRVFEPKHPQ
jgi:hypothetical protein